MRFHASPFSSAADIDGVDSTLDGAEAFNGSFGWLWTTRSSSGKDDTESSSGEKEEDDERHQLPSRPPKRQKTATEKDDDPTPDLDDPTTWQVDDVYDDLQALVEDAATKGVALPSALLTFLTSQRIYDTYFEAVDGHYINLGRHLVPFQDGFLVEILRCNQDANFLVLFLTKQGGDHCVAWTNEEFDWDALAAPNHGGHDEKGQLRQQPMASDFSLFAASVEEGLWKLKAEYDHM